MVIHVYRTFFHQPPRAFLFESMCYCAFQGTFSPFKVEYAEFIYTYIYISSHFAFGEFPFRLVLSRDGPDAPLDFVCLELLLRCGVAYLYPGSGTHVFQQAISIPAFKSQNHITNPKAAAPVHGWGYPLPIFIYPGFHRGSYGGDCSFQGCFWWL